MKRLHIDCSMGCAGDMLAAALLEIHPDPDGVLARLNAAGLPGVEFRRERAVRGGIAGTRLVVAVGGRVEGEVRKTHTETRRDRDTEEREGEHGERGVEEILAMVDSLALPAGVRAAAGDVYRLLAEAESRVHGRPVGEVHFHELGALDAVADIAAVCLLMAELAPDEASATPVNVGGGTVQCAHGVLPVPAPATACLLEGIPAFGDPVLARELCTPTGAALLRRFVGRWGAMPPMVASAVGHGAGSGDFPERANLVRCTLGEVPEEDGGEAGEEVVELVCNLDDMTGEELAFAMGRLFDAGALDVAAVPATMKKGRPGHVLTVLCAPRERDGVLAALFRHTTTLGVRARICRRWTLERRDEPVVLPDGSTVRCKISCGFGVRRAKYEHDDLAGLALERGVSLRELSAGLPPP
ncbi:MAG: nickel pincer cofactor biosynthesis protein LarC [Kiritimatiellae bacterium]|nr:nickel pincer cofactor biosynthesis protein LarC [Kiritimatiellia bacterium]